MGRWALAHLSLSKGRSRSYNGRSWLRSARKGGAFQCAEKVSGRRRGFAPRGADAGQTLWLAAPPPAGHGEARSPASPILRVRGRGDGDCEEPLALNLKRIRVRGFPGSARLTMRLQPQYYLLRSCTIVPAAFLLLARISYGRVVLQSVMSQSMPFLFTCRILLRCPAAAALGTLCRLSAMCPPSPSTRLPHCALLAFIKCMPSLGCCCVPPPVPAVTAAFASNIPALAVSRVAPTAGAGADRRRSQCAVTAGSSYHLSSQCPSPRWSLEGRKEVCLADSVSLLLPLPHRAPAACKAFAQEEEGAGSSKRRRPTS